MKWFAQHSKYAIRIAVIYLLISFLWIFFSDWLLGKFTSDGELLVQLQIYKGFFFVLVTSVLLFYLIRRSTKAILKNRAKTEKALQEKQALLVELHHRVKNNLTLICSLIELQVSTLDKSESAALLETQYRIYTLAEIEELLYKNKDMSRIAFSEYIRQFTSELEQSETNKLSFQVQVDEVYLHIDQAIPLGLLFNEILTQLRISDSTKQNYSVKVRFTCPSPEEILMKLHFDGVSYSEFDLLRKEGNIEKMLMELYVKQLDSSESWVQKNGSILYTLTFDKAYL